MTDSVTATTETVGSSTNNEPQQMVNNDANEKNHTATASKKDTDDDVNDADSHLYANKHIPRFLSLDCPSVLHNVHDDDDDDDTNDDKTDNAVISTQKREASDFSVRRIAKGSTALSVLKRDPSSPLIVQDTPESIGIKTPSKEDFTVRSIADLIGHEYPISVIDVQHQEEDVHQDWTLGDLVRYFEDEQRLQQVNLIQQKIQNKRQGVPTTNVAVVTPPPPKPVQEEAPPRRRRQRRAAARHSFIQQQNQQEDDQNSSNQPNNGPSLLGPPKILNQISLEFSKTALVQRVTSPSFVRQLDWIDAAWPKNLKHAKPLVQYYCLTSTAGCYTDFHVDFGGTSVWYHVQKGCKEFLLIPPTAQNLASYEDWLCRPNQSQIFFPDLLLSRQAENEKTKEEPKPTNQGNNGVESTTNSKETPGEQSEKIETGTTADKNNVVGSTDEAVKESTDKPTTNSNNESAVENSASNNQDQETKTTSDTVVSTEVQDKKADASNTNNSDDDNKEEPPEKKDTMGIRRVVLKQSQTLYIPSGWIHAVYTPQDSIVFGGNFLHGLDIDTQMAIYCLETRTRVPGKFRFPNFVPLMMYTGQMYVERCRAGQIMGRVELNGLEQLAKNLGLWSKVVETTIVDPAMVQAMKQMNIPKMLQDLTSEIERLKQQDTITPHPDYKASTTKLRLKLNDGLKKRAAKTPSFRITLPSSALSSMPTTAKARKRGRHKSNSLLQSMVDDDDGEDEDEWVPDDKPKALKRASSSGSDIKPPKRRKPPPPPPPSAPPKPTIMKGKMQRAVVCHQQHHVVKRNSKSSTVRERLLKRWK